MPADYPNPIPHPAHRFIRQGAPDSRRRIITGLTGSNRHVTREQLGHRTSPASIPRAAGALADPVVATKRLVASLLSSDSPRCPLPRWCAPSRALTRSVPTGRGCGLNRLCADVTEHRTQCCDGILLCLPWTSRSDTCAPSSRTPRTPFMQSQLTIVGIVVRQHRGRSSPVTAAVRGGGRTRSLSRASRRPPSIALG
jgi:hypothetical protein